jgi:hypothetical protein
MTRQFSHAFNYPIRLGGKFGSKDEEIFSQSRSKRIRSFIDSVLRNANEAFFSIREFVTL